MTSAAMSRSRMAEKALPSRPLVRFLAITVITTISASISR